MVVSLSGVVPSEPDTSTTIDKSRRPLFVAGQDSVQFSPWKPKLHAQS